jgi:uncharacterized lipoprotein NlpE involved in copper resistance
MLNKKLIVSAFAISLTIFTIGCDNDKDEKEETAEIEQVELKADNTKNNSTLPDGKIALDKLPVAAKEFIEKQYVGYTITGAASDPLCQGGEAIDVAVTKPVRSNLSLIFKPDGSFVQQEEDVPMKTAPDKVRNVIAAKYADYKADDQIEKLQLADKTVQYLVDLTKGTTTKEVIFSKEGVIVCEH